MKSQQLTADAKVTNIDILDTESLFYKSTMDDIKCYFARKSTYHTLQVYCYTKEQEERLMLMINWAGFNAKSEFIDGFCYEITVTRREKK